MTQYNKKSIKSGLIQYIVNTELLSINHILAEKGKIYTFLNPVSYLTALDNKQIFNCFDGIFADGSLLAIAIKILYGKQITRRSFDMTSLAPQLLEHASKTGKSIYIVASKQEETEKAIKIFKERYPNLIIAGYRNGYFKSEKEQIEEAEHIKQINPNYLIVGMGALMQEQFLIKVKRIGYQGIGFTCGGFIHQTSKNEIDYYPAWIDKINLRFIYRMYKEKHTRKRYLTAAFIFPYRFLAERFSK